MPAPHWLREEFSQSSQRYSIVIFVTYLFRLGSVAGICHLGIGLSVAVLEEPFSLFFHKVMMVKNASVWDLRCGGRVTDMNSVAISAQMEDKYSPLNYEPFAPH